MMLHKVYMSIILLLCPRDTQPQPDSLSTSDGAHLLPIACFRFTYPFAATCPVVLIILAVTNNKNTRVPGFPHRQLVDPTYVTRLRIEEICPPNHTDPAKLQKSRFPFPLIS